MGQEHISYILKYASLSVDFLCDPNQSSIDTALSLLKQDQPGIKSPTVVSDEKELLEHASPNYMHTPQLLKWGVHDITILVEKPVAVSEKQVLALKAAHPNFRANICVGMEYRFIPAINKLLQLIPSVGTIKKISIRENRYPFLSKIAEWNKDVEKSGDTLVEKCCHFFDLFRLISGQEMTWCVSKVHRGLLWDHYGYDDQEHKEDVIPIIDSAYVLLDFDDNSNTVEKPNKHSTHHSTLGCLELCMFAEGSRHQEEIIVTGMKGRVEAYLPENKVFLYHRPTRLWTDRSKPPPEESFSEVVYDCSDLTQVYEFAADIPTMHSGYHYCSTAIEWKYLIDAIEELKNGNSFVPKVSLDDGIKAVEMGIKSMANISSNAEAELPKIAPITAFSSKSSDNLLDLVLNASMAANNANVADAFMRVIDACDEEYKVNVA
eukprot:scaffold783_cov197-Alexandrium_tamarense.AAC.25